MKGAVLAALFGAAMAVIAGQLSSPNRSAAAVEHRAVAPTGGLVAFSSSVSDGQQLTVVDPSSHVVCVYHIDGASGKIALQSVRNIHWDLQLVDYNGVAPAPGAIHAQLQQR